MGRERRALVTGGAGFVGSHLCERLIAEDYRVVCVDNLCTGSLQNIAHLQENPRFDYLEQDIADYLEVPGSLTEVYHFASPASPVDFGRLAIPILRVGAAGTYNALELATEKGARFMLASTSEVYGDPLVHPQEEEYRGNVSPTGVRAVYDEAKRYAESMTMAYHRHREVDSRIVRIFNTFGPRMRADDGRMVPNFITQALAGDPLTLYGEGTQTRSLQYIDDLIDGVIRLMRSREWRPVNVGNPVEHTVGEIARLIVELARSESTLVYKPLPEDDPKQRCPDISRARRELGWEPKVSAVEGIERTLDWFAGHVMHTKRDRVSR